MSRLLSVVFLLTPLHVFGQLAQYVNPFVGTGGHGHTFPGATAPFGMVQLSPDTRIDPLDWDGCSGYHYSDSLIYGFSHTHLSGTGVADYGDVLIVPYTHGARLEPAEYAQPFKKNTEKATPGYYSVLLERDRIRCEMTATERVGMHRYSYPLNREKGKILIDLRHRDEVLDAHLEVVGPTEIAGYRISKGWAKEQHLYFVVRFSKRIAGSIVLDMTKNPREAMPSVTSKGIVGLFDFYLNEEPVVVAMGISGVSMEGARRNLDAECKDLDFDKVRSETLAKWEAQLGKIDVQGGSMEQRSTFYSALYHSMLAPNIWNDVDGQYRGRDNTVHRAEGHDVYSVFSLWDTHRAAHPLLAILEPKRTNDFVQTFLRQYEQGGLLPVWELAANETDCMIGYHSVSVIADAYAKGIRGFDLEKAVEAAQKSANQDRLGLASFRKLGYVAADAEPESVSKTLEYAYDDWCVGQLALAAGNKPVFEEFSRRAQYYKNVFDPGTSFFRAKNNAKWHEPFDPFEVNFNYTEANAWQYRFSAPHDVDGLAECMGGMTGLARNLDALFSAKSNTTGRNQADITGMIGQYVQGNEPSHHIAYLYNFVGQPHKAQSTIRRILDEQYSNAPDGLSGNEDCGQMSAWYVLSAMGFYPPCPGKPFYTFGTPLFEKATIHLPNGKKFAITAKGASAKRPYIAGVRFDGQAWEKNWFEHDLMMTGGEFALDMSESVAPWGSSTAQCPGTSISAPPIASVPFVKSGTRSFREKQSVELASPDASARIYYVLGSADAKPKQYVKPITVSESTQIRFWAEKNGQRSLESTAFFTKMPKKIRILRYNTHYSPQYTGRGDEGLIDGLQGPNLDFRTGDWQGFEGQDLDLVLDLGKATTVSELRLGCLRDDNAWIFYPTSIRLEGSSDGKDFTVLGEASIPPQTAALSAEKRIFNLKISEKKKFRYWRVVGSSPLKCPDWHKGRSLSAWIFADEVELITP